MFLSSDIEAGYTGDAAVSHSSLFSANLGKIWVNLSKIWANLDKFG